MTTTPRALGAALLGTGAAAAGGLAWAGLVERNAFALRRVEVPVLPDGLPPLRLLHVSDLHLVPRQRRKVAWVRGLAALEPDLVVATGDLLAGADAVPAVLEALEPLLEVPGVFVLGSNDYFAPTLKNPARYLGRNHRHGVGTSAPLPTGDLVAGLTAGGWLDLDNARGALTVAGVRLGFVGVDDPHLDRDDYAAAAASAPPPDDVDLRVGVTHAPYQRVLDAMVGDGADLVLAGHTHGGQLCVPFLGALVTNCDLDTGRAKGLSRWWKGAGGAPSGQAPQDAAWLHVSAGLGTAPTAPVRFACRPEASLLTLAPR